MGEKQTFLAPPVRGTASDYARRLINSIARYYQRVYPHTFADGERYQTVISDDTKAILTEAAGKSEGDILRELSGDRMLIPATPGTIFTEILATPETQPSIPVAGYFGPHPSDFVDFLGGTIKLMQGVEIYEFLVTAGEKGAPPLSTEETRRIREQETMVSSEMLGITTLPLPVQVPDGEAIHHISFIARQIQKQIVAHNLQIIFAPAPEVDHPDHVAVHFAVLEALQSLKDEGYFDRRALPALYITDPEFGFNSAGEWAFRKVSSVFPERYPASSRFLRRGTIDQVGIDPMVVPGFIISIPDQTMEEATEALYAHKTQMWETGGQEKSYRRKIPAFKRLRGLQIGKPWGEGLRQYTIPGITSYENMLLNYLPIQSMYERHSHV